MEHLAEPVVHLTVEDVMTYLVVKLRSNETLPEAASRLAQSDISGAPVVRGEKIVGIVSGSDLKRTGATTVGSVMTRHVFTTTPSATIMEAASVMERHGVKRLPVCDTEGELLGVVSRSDILGAIVRMHASRRIA
jgi:CBS domain-containing protein